MNKVFSLIMVLSILMLGVFAGCQNTDMNSVDKIDDTSNDNVDVVEGPIEEIVVEEEEISDDLELGELI